MSTPPTDLPPPGPLDRERALAVLAAADALLAEGEFGTAAAAYARVIGHPDADLTAAGWYGLAEARYRTDDETGALAAWEAAARVGETPVAWRAWKQVAAARVRLARDGGGDLGSAIAAYREAERRAPPAERGEIASRLGWLSKEQGDARAAGRYFARARGGTGSPLATYAILALMVGVWVGTVATPEGQRLLDLLMLDKARLAAGEWWRLLTPVLVHDDASPLHLFFNMYALFLAGPIVEAIYGRATFVTIYLLCAAAGSVASFVFTPADSVGASGAIFGLFGVLFAAMRTHQPIVDRRSRALMGQIGGLIVINLALGFSLGFVDNAAHVGGLAAGLWLGYLLVPGNVPTLASLWQRGGTPLAAEGRRGSAFIRAAGILVLVFAIAAMLIAGIALR